MCAVVPPWEYNKYLGEKNNFSKLQKEEKASSATENCSDLAHVVQAAQRDVGNGILTLGDCTRGLETSSKSQIIQLKGCLSSSHQEKNAKLTLIQTDWKIASSTDVASPIPIPTHTHTRYISPLLAVTIFILPYWVTQLAFKFSILLYCCYSIILVLFYYNTAISYKSHLLLLLESQQCLELAHLLSGQFQCKKFL